MALGFLLAGLYIPKQLCMCDNPSVYLHACLQVREPELLAGVGSVGDDKLR